MTYTHIFCIHTKQMRPIEEAPIAVRERSFQVSGFLLLDIDRVHFDQHGNPCYGAYNRERKQKKRGGWSYGHIQHGWICAGAGGLNSMRVMPI